MSTIDLTDLQEATDEATVVKLKGGDIVLKPLMEVGAEHDDDLLALIEEFGKLNLDRDGEDAAAGFDLAQIRTMMPLVNRILRMAAPTKKEAERLLKLPLMARFKVLMEYVGDQDLGGLVPSES